MKSKKNFKKIKKKKVFSKKGGFTNIAKLANLNFKRSLCRKITDDYRESSLLEGGSPLNWIEFEGKCKNFMYEGKKICDIDKSRFDPLYGKNADDDPSWRKKKWCDLKKPQQIKHSKSTENMYKKGELNRRTNVGAIKKEREQIEALKKKEEIRKAEIKKELEKDNFRRWKSPRRIWKSLNNHKKNIDNFSNYRSPKQTFKYLNKKNKVGNKVTKVATKYEFAEL